jgi:hypothetical protein
MGASLHRPPQHGGKPCYSKAEYDRRNVSRQTLDFEGRDCLSTEVPNYGHP